MNPSYLNANEIKILTKLENYETEMIEFLQQMVKADSQNPPGNEEACAVLIQDKLLEFGAEVELQEVEPGRKNVIGIVEGKCKEKIVFNGHLDTVGIGKEENWLYPPLGGLIVDGKIHGRGAADMKGGLVAMLYAMKVLKEIGVPLERGLLYTGVVDEEVFFKGTLKLIETGKLSDGVYAFVTEPTNMTIKHCLKGGIEFKARVRGKSSHSAMVEQGDNAIFKINKVITALEDYDQKLRSQGTYSTVGYSSVNVGTIRGGIGVTLVPEECEIEFDRQVLPRETIQAARKEVQDVIAQVEERYGFQVELTETQYFNPWIIDKDSRIVVETAEAFKHCLDQKASIEGLAGYCEVELLAQAGIPGVVFGPGHLELAHKPNEFVPIDELLKSAQVLAIAAFRLANNK